MNIAAPEDVTNKDEDLRKVRHPFFGCQTATTLSALELFMKNLLLIAALFIFSACLENNNENLPSYTSSEIETDLANYNEKRLIFTNARADFTDLDSYNSYMKKLDNYAKEIDHMLSKYDRDYRCTDRPGLKVTGIDQIKAMMGVISNLREDLVADPVFGTSIN